MEEHPDRRADEEVSVMEYDPKSGEYRVAATKKRLPRVQTVLFALTLLSTMFAGGVSYSISLIAILLTHEMGHYLMARRYRIPATLPYFLPMPLTIFGTFGAVIKMDGRWATRKQLFDVGIAGPLAGVMVAIPVSVIGIALSDVVAEAAVSEGFLNLGDSILFSSLTYLVAGSLPEGNTLMLHPVAFAGWVGLFVTALNLLPIGQLDGGHVVYGLFGRRAARISLVALIAFALLAVFASLAWLLPVILLLYFGYRHPPAREEEKDLDSKRNWLGFATLILFVVTFTPVPISLNI